MEKTARMANLIGVISPSGIVEVNLRTTLLLIEAETIKIEEDQKIEDNLVGETADYVHIEPIR
jgi:hypothetical protein